MSHTSSIRSIAAATLFVLVAGASTAVPAGAAGPRMVARGPQARLFHDEGTAPASARMRLALVLRYRDGASLDRLVAAQSDPDSPLFHHFLTAAQFRATYAPSAAAYARVAADLRRAGFSVETGAPNRTILDATASVASIERYFGTTIHRVAIRGARHLANIRPAYLPAELERDVTAVTGFDDVAWFENAVQIGTRIPPVDEAIHGRLRGPAPFHALGPRAFAEGYDLPVQHLVAGGSGGATYDGTGRVIGLISISDPLDTDLASWLSYFGITRTGTTKRIPVDGGAGGSDGFLPATLDYETTAGLAPGANIDIYELPDIFNAQIIDVFNRIVSDNEADVIDTPFGDCEILNTIDPTAISQIFEQGSSLGQTFDAPMDITGPTPPGCDQFSVYAPADSPFAVAIGGTLFNVRNNGKYFGEDYWDDGGFIGAGGGGVSSIFPLPSYQKNVSGIVASGRNVPDLAFDADGNTGEAMFIGGQWLNVGSVGGTELGTGIFAACALETAQMGGQRLGLVNGTLYKNWLRRGYGHGATVRAHDIIGGVPWPPLVPRPGFDLASGIGSLDCFNAATTLL